MMSLMGDRLKLRPLLEADLEDLDRFATDPEALGPFEWFGFDAPSKRRQRWEEDGFIDPKSTMLAVSLEDDTMIGIVSWARVRENGPAGGSFEIGVALFPEHRGQGFGTVAQRLLVEYLFAHTLANRLQAITEVDNIAEQNALERVGFQREGTMRQAVFRDGNWRDLVLYSLLRGEEISQA